MDFTAFAATMYSKIGHQIPFDVPGAVTKKAVKQGPQNSSSRAGKSAGERFLQHMDFTAFAATMYSKIGRQILI
jgi:hypothetical protein